MKHTKIDAKTRKSLNAISFYFSEHENFEYISVQIKSDLLFPWKIPIAVRL